VLDGPPPTGRSDTVVKVTYTSSTVWNSLSDDLRDPIIRRLALTVSDVCLKLGCFQRSTSTHSALEVSHFMRYMNSRLAYLITYNGIGIVWCSLPDRSEAMVLQLHWCERTVV